MIDPDASASGEDSTVATYEEVRAHILVGSPGGQHFGLVVLLREGIAAWIERRATCWGPASATPDRAVRMPLLIGAPSRRDRASACQPRFERQRGDETVSIEANQKVTAGHLNRSAYLAPVDHAAGL